MDVITTGSKSNQDQRFNLLFQHTVRAHMHTETETDLFRATRSNKILTCKETRKGTKIIENYEPKSQKSKIIDN